MNPRKKKPQMKLELGRLKKRNNIWKFQKIRTKNLNVDNYEIY
jgi:hypothetical protein